MNNKFKKLAVEDIIHTIYTSKIIEISATQNCITLIRHQKNKIGLSEILYFCDACLIFHNFIEYNTFPSLTIKKCLEYKIPYFIFSEYLSPKKFYCSFNNTDISFRQSLKYISPRDKCNILFSDEDIIETETVKDLDLEKVRENLQYSYEQTKKNRAIKLLYDKDLLKGEKTIKRTTKEMKKIQFNQNRLTYYKSTTE